MVCDFASDSVRGEKSQTENLPVMSDSVRGPRRLIGEFDVGLGPWSESSPSPNPNQTAPESLD